MDYKLILKLMVEHLEEGIIVVDNNLKIMYFNEPSTDITGFDRDEAIGNNIFDVFPNINKSDSTFWKAVNLGKPIIEHVQNYVNCKGKSVSKLTSTIPIIKNGEIEGAIEIFRDLTNVRELSEKVLLLEGALHRKRKCGSKHLENGTQYTFEDVIGNSLAINQIKRNAYRIADSSSPVYIYGETGTGKELIVQGIHNSSNRRNKPFIAQNCGALPESLLESILFGTTKGSFTGAKDRPGLFELADGGTLFLDELNSMDLGLQSKLLRVLQDGVIRRIGSTETKKVNVRVIAASNTDPGKLITEGKLREDLYYRLNVIYFYIPPLRERKEDIPILIDYFINTLNQEMNKSIKGVDHKVMEDLYSNDWPGNIRELQNMIERTMNFVDDDYITLEDLQICNYSIVSNKSILDPQYKFERSEDIALKIAVERYEKNLIKNAIEKADYNYAKAARALKVPRQTLYGKLRRYGLS